MNSLIKLALAALLFLCLFDMPYGFYQLVIFMAMIGFGFLAFKANEEKKQTEFFVYVALALLFQPIFKISLGRELWNIVDIIVAGGLVLTARRK